jgi:hypothetical protein
MLKVSMLFMLLSAVSGKCPEGFTLRSVCSDVCQRPGAGCDCTEDHPAGGTPWVFGEESMAPTDCHRMERQKACVACCKANQVAKCVDKYGNQRAPQ